MIVLSHLLSGLGRIYVIFWGVMAVVLAGLLTIVEIFGPWSDEDGPVSAWSTVGTQAPLWFLFTMGIMLSTVSLPVAVAHGITRRAFCLGAGVFAVASAVVFGLMVTLGYGVEYLVYDATGVLAELDQPYPRPTVAEALRTILSCLGFLLSGWVVGLCFYRLIVWQALAALPLAVAPIVIWLQLPPSASRLGGGGVVPIVLVIAMAAACYLMARNAPLRPRKG